MATSTSVNTQAQWQAVMGNNPSNSKGEYNPVENVSWNDCLAFIYKLNKMYGRKFRLPKEAEWEFAARGGNKTNNYTYSGSNNIDEVGWFTSNSMGSAHPVGMKKSNELGIYDMCGNEWELCEDFFHSTGRGHVMRGGSWVCDAHECTVYFRGNCYDPDRKGFGLRLVMDVEKTNLSEEIFSLSVEDAVETANKVTESIHKLLGF